MKLTDDTFAILQELNNDRDDQTITQIYNISERRYMMNIL